MSVKRGSTVQYTIVSIYNIMIIEYVVVSVRQISLYTALTDGVGSRSLSKMLMLALERVMELRSPVKCLTIGRTHRGLTDVTNCHSSLNEQWSE